MADFSYYPSPISVISNMWRYRDDIFGEGVGPESAAAREWQKQRSALENEVRLEWIKDQYPNWEQMTEQERMQTAFPEGFGGGETVLSTPIDQMVEDLGTSLPEWYTMGIPYEWTGNGAEWDQEVWGQIESGTATEDITAGGGTTPSPGDVGPPAPGEPGNEGNVWDLAGGNWNWDLYPPPSNEQIPPPGSDGSGEGLPPGYGGGGGTGGGTGGEGGINIPGLPPIFGGGSEDPDDYGVGGAGVPDGFWDTVGDFGEDALGWLGQNWQQALGIGVNVAGAYIGAEAGKDAAQIEADAMLEQGRMQDRLARDLTATGLDWSKENRDIMLAGTEPYRNSAALALAGMMDMTGLDRTQLPGAPDPMAPNPGTQVGVGESMGGTLGADGEPAYEGVSSYEPGMEYDPNRMWSGTDLLRNAPEYDWQADPSYQWRMDEGMRTLENSAGARGGVLSGGFARDVTEYGQGMASNEFSNIYNRLGTIAGFAPQGGTQPQNPGAATQFGGAGINALDSIGAAGSARAQGQIAAGNAWQQGLSQIGGLMGSWNQWGRG